jgi:hypothetical protein
MDGYVGVNTAMDIAAAEMYEKRARFIEEPEDRGTMS